MERISFPRVALEAGVLAAVAVVGPFGAGPGQGGGKVDPARPFGWQDAASVAEGGGFGGPQRGVVQAAEERVHVLAARSLGAGGSQGRFGHLWPIWCRSYV